MAAKEEAGEKKQVHMARVYVTDPVWAGFKQAAHRRHVTVSTYLGTLMEREVTRLAAVAAREESLSVQEATAALDEVASLRDDLDRIAQRLKWAAEWSRSHPQPQQPATPVHSIPAPHSRAELAAMTDDELIALGKPKATEPISGDWFKRGS